MKTILISSLLILLCWSCHQPAAPEKKVKPDTGKVAVVPPPKVDTALKHIYITFDDGPLEGSEDIDDAVRKEKINVNVFVVGEHALSNERMKRYYRLYEANPYIEIGNHSYSHAHDHYKKFYVNPSNVVTDFKRCDSAIHIPTNLARLPGRNQWRLKGVHLCDIHSGSSSADSLYHHGYRVFGWDVEWQHNGENGDPIQTVDQMVAMIERKLNDHKTVTPDHLV